MVVGAMMLVAIVTQSPATFLLVSALLWLNVLVPAANPFENFYNRFVARRRGRPPLTPAPGDRKSTRLNSSHITISYAVFCLKKKKQNPSRPSHARCRRTHLRLA